MKQIEADVVVIGAGTAGLAAFSAARKITDRVLLVEGGPYGTMCARVGCMPSKLLIAAANAAHGARSTKPFGVETDAVRVNGRAVMTRLKRERDRFVAGVLKDMADIPDELKLEGWARFEDDHHLLVGDDHRIKARAVVIATGGKASVPDMFDGLGDRVVVSDDLFDWDTLPRRVAVFGPGNIGLELGQALHRLDVHVRMFGKGGVLAGIGDPAVKRAASEAFQNEFYLDTDADIDTLTRQGDEVEITFKDLDGQRCVERFDYVLVATGRAPYLDALTLDRTSLQRDKKGVPLSDAHTKQCGDSSIFIAGDCDASAPVLHEAAAEGSIAGGNAARFPDVHAHDRFAMLAITFSSPQVAIVGTPFDKLAAGSFVTGEVDFSDQGRARIMMENKGMLRVYADRSNGKLLGAEMVCPGAEHLAHMLAWSVQQSLTLHDLRALPFYHPTLQEGLRTALRDAAARLE
ncbi:dihydrolipoyl dehydrogenase [Alcaligenaceae bacterium B3P038]|nr:dihydrolipoyl dehydrogenase [Alcaligenaceae bacterium B3P038]